MTWRSPDRLDRQVADLWGVAALGAIALIPFSRTFLSALPLCPLRTLTGLPCPTCGATRAAEAMLGGHVLDAVLYNPLVTLAALAFLGKDRTHDHRKRAEDGDALREIDSFFHHHYWIGVIELNSRIMAVSLP